MFPKNFDGIVILIVYQKWQLNLVECSLVVNQTNDSKIRRVGSVTSIQNHKHVFRPKLHDLQLLCHFITSLWNREIYSPKPEFWSVGIDFSLIQSARLLKKHEPEMRFHLIMCAEQKTKQALKYHIVSHFRWVAKRVI